MAVPDEKPVRSPCIGICRLDADDYCIGCGRSGLEIGEWGVMESAEKRTVLVRIAQRQARRRKEG